MYDKALLVLLSFVLFFTVTSHIITSNKPSQNNKSSHKEIAQEFPKRREIPSTFSVFNYLKKPVYLEIDGKRILAIQAQDKASISEAVVATMFIRGKLCKIFIDVPGNPILFTQYTLNVPEGETIRALHIGMVTGKWVGASEDYNIGKTGNAVQGMPFIHIHNWGEGTLRLNENINVPPNQTATYSGRDHMGVRLGTVLKDANNIFPNYIIRTPITDLYYGVVSDLPQAEFGGFQLTPEFEHDTTEPHFLLEKGWIGGPAYQNIEYGYLPYEGTLLRPVDKWGLPLLKSPSAAREIE